NPAVTAGKMTAHLQDDRRKGQHKADPEAPRHTSEFGIWRRVQRCHFGLQRHAADRAVSWTDLADLWMHRAGVDRAFRRGGVRLSGVMVMATITGVIVTAAAAGTLCSASIRVFGSGHRTLHHGPCNLYPVGVYMPHAKRHQGILPKTPEPDRGPGSRPGQNG